MLNSYASLDDFYILCIFPPETLKVHEGNIVKIVWVPPEYGDAVACISTDGIVSLWEEVVEGIIDWVYC